MKLSLLLVFVFYSSAFKPSSPPEPIDFVEDAILKYVNHSVDPCEDFYRHACSFDSPPNSMITASLNETYEYIKKAQKNSFWNDLNIIKDFAKLEDRKLILSDIEYTSDFYSDIFDAVCEKHIDLLPDFEDRLGRLIRVKTNETTGAETCNSSTDQIRKIVHEKLSALNFAPWELAYYYRVRLGDVTNFVKSINAHLDVDVRQGIVETRKMIESIKEMAEALIEDTPWVKSRHLEEKIKNITSKLELHDNYGKDFEKVTDALFNMEKAYFDCKMDYDFVHDADLFCYVSTATRSRFPDVEYEAFNILDNAWNNHPVLAFGFPNYYHNQYGREMSTKLGYTGSTVGHEIGHTFFDNHDDPQFLPYFSNEVEECVQNQFNSTCTEYKEESCATSDEFLEENGADIFGLELSYQLLDQYYSDKKKDIIARLNVTYEQSFFYGYTAFLCRGSLSRVRVLNDGRYDPHSAYNVRANIVAQHPAFQDAFNCSPSSRMMKSATKKCHIYGDKAPNAKKKINHIF